MGCHEIMIWFQKGFCSILNELRLDYISYSLPDVFLIAVTNLGRIILQRVKHSIVHSTYHVQWGGIVCEGAFLFHAQFCLHKIKLIVFNTFVIWMIQKNWSHENFLQQGCHPIVQTDGQSSALVQVGWFCKGRGAKLSP